LASDRSFDGLPVAPSRADLDERDAAQLDRHWRALPELLEGQFSALRIDLEMDRVEVLLDPLGLVPVFIAHVGDGHLLSNSAVLLARLIRTREPDPFGSRHSWASGGRPRGTRCSTGSPC